MGKNIELLKAITELREEVKHLREAVETLLDIVIETKYEPEEEPMSLDAHKTGDRLSIYR